MKRTIPLFFLLLLITACTSGAGGRLGGEPAEDEIIELVYQDWRTDWFPGMAQEMLDKFHEQHPNIRVFYTPDPENVINDMPPIFEAGTAPDVINGCCDYFPGWAQAGYLLNLRPFVERDIPAETIAEWDNAQYSSFFLGDDEQYALPKYHGALVVYYNKDLFDQFGVDYPARDWTYDDYLAAMSALTADVNGSAGIDIWGSTLDPIYDRIQIHVNSFGGHYANPDDPTDCMLDEPEAVAALEWLRARIWDDRVMATTLALSRVETRQAFWEQRVAMVEDGSWALKDILANADFRVGVATFPAGPARRATLSTTDGFAISAATEHPEEAWELLKFLTGEEYGLAMARANFLQPARASLVDDWAEYVRTEFPEKAQDLDLEAFADGQVEGYSVTAEVFANMQGVRAATDSAFEDILTLGLVPAQGRLRQACEQIELLQENTN